MSDTDWPERTDWDVEAQAAWTNGRRKHLTELAAKQRADVERETQRVPDDPVQVESERGAEFAGLSRLRRLWQYLNAPGRCKACGRKGASIEIPDWRAGYNTYRCRFCLRWGQTKIPSSEGGE